MKRETCTSRYVVGCMTGTSLDGLDAALVRIDGRGWAMRANLVGMVSQLLGALADELRELTRGKPVEPVRFLRAARRLGEIHAQAIEQLLREHHAGRQPDFVVAHGQTIWHAPAEHLSWQLFDPWPVVQRIGVPVCFDLRQADLAGSGQGAPITPASDWVMYRSSQHARLIVNLGGVCNVTYLPRAAEADDAALRARIRGADVGPCNLLIDGLVHRLRPDLEFDVDGKLAREGSASDVLGEIAQKTSPFFSRALPRTTGREDFTAAWVERVMAESRAAAVSEKDLVASAVEYVARLVGQASNQALDVGGGVEIVLAGGGAKNPVLVERITHHAAKVGRVIRSDELGVPVDAREAMGFAVLGALSQDGEPITLSAVTGANKPGVAGTWAGLRH